MAVQQREKKTVIVDVGRMFDREPPRALEAEMAVLGSMILDPAVVPSVLEIVKQETAFSREDHAAIFRALVDLYSARSSGDLVQLVDMLRDRRQLESLGGGSCRGVDYLESLVSGVPSAVNAPHFARIVSAKSRVRAIIEACGKTLYDCYHAETQDTDEVVACAMERVASAGMVERPASSLQAAERSVIHDLVYGHGQTYRTGVPWIDKMIGGLPKSGVVTFFGYPSSGKTTATLTLAVNLALGRGGADKMPVRVSSYEQGSERIAATLLASASGVPVHKYLNGTGRASVDEIERVEAVARDHAECDFQIYDRNLPPPELLAACAACAAGGKRGVLVCDYIQDIPPWGKFIEQTPRITEGMRVLSEVARDLGWLVILVSQLDKMSARANKRPQMADGLGSSAIEQRSDVIVSVYRPHFRERRPDVDEQSMDLRDMERLEHWRARHGRVDFDVIKNKYGPLAVARVMFDGRNMSYRDATNLEANHWGDDDA